MNSPPSEQITGLIEPTTYEDLAALLDRIAKQGSDWPGVFIYHSGMSGSLEFTK